MNIHHNSQSIAQEIAARYGVIVPADLSVKVIPTGKSATTVEYVWNGSALVAVDAERARDLWRKASQSKAEREIKARRIRDAASKRKPMPKTEKVNGNDARLEAARKRLEAVREFAPTHTIEEIAAFMGATINGAQKYVSKYAIDYVRRKPQGRPAHPATAGKIAGYAERYAAGESVESIAASAGIHVKSLCKMLRNVGMKPRLQPKRPKAAEGAPKAPRKRKDRGKREANKALVDARREQVRALVEEGLTSAQIADRLGIKVRLVIGDRAAMGIPAKGGFFTKPAAMLARIEARRKTVLELRMKGMTRSAIADAIGVSPYVISQDFAALGIANPKPAPVAWNPEFTRRVVAMRANDMTFTVIANQLGIARSTVQRIYQAAGSAA